MSGSTQCAEIKDDGERCKAWSIKGSDRCWSHAPELAKKRAKARRKGGRARSNGDVPAPGRIDTVHDVLAGLDRVVQATWRQDNTAARTRALVGAYRAALKAIEVGEIEERISALERIVEERGLDRRGYAGR